MHFVFTGLWTQGQVARRTVDASDEEAKIKEPDLSSIFLTQAENLSWKECALKRQLYHDKAENFEIGDKVLHEEHSEEMRKTDWIEPDRI